MSQAASLSSETHLTVPEMLWDVEGCLGKGERRHLFAEHQARRVPKGQVSCIFGSFHLP